MRNGKLATAVALAGAMAVCGAEGAQAATAIFAGGCFWSIESDLDHAPGVTKTTSGYIGGHVDNPTYDQVVTETTGHREAVKVEYDPAVTSYEKLLDIFFHVIDPTDPRGQFCDFGESYTTAVYAGSAEELKLAEAEKSQSASELGREVVTTIAMAPTFYAAEEIHQDFWQGTEMLGNGLTRAEHYARYRQGCGKNAKVQAVWGKDAFRGLNGHA